MAKQVEAVKHAWNTNAAIDFVAAYNSCSSLDQVCETLKMRKSTVQSRARYCRKAGLTLREFGGRGKIDWSAVKASIKED